MRFKASKLNKLVEDLARAKAAHQTTCAGPDGHCSIGPIEFINVGVDPEPQPCTNCGLRRMAILVHAPQ